MNKKNYIHPQVIANAMLELDEFAKSCAKSALPLYEFAKDKDAYQRAVYVRAAKRLGWDILRTKGHVYENGQFIW